MLCYWSTKSKLRNHAVFNLVHIYIYIYRKGSWIGDYLRPAPMHGIPSYTSTCVSLITHRPIPNCDRIIILKEGIPHACLSSRNWIVWWQLGSLLKTSWALCSQSANPLMCHHSRSWHGYFVDGEIISEQVWRVVSAICGSHSGFESIQTVAGHLHKHNLTLAW